MARVTVLFVRMLLEYYCDGGAPKQESAGLLDRFLSCSWGFFLREPDIACIENEPISR